MIPVVRFDPKARDNLTGMFEAQCRGTDPYTPGQRCRAQLAEILSWGLDTRSMVRSVGREGVVLVKGLPVDPILPASPQDGKRPNDKETFVSEGVLNAASHILRMHPVAYHNEKDGDLIHQIAPVPGNETSVSNQGAYLFELHTEATHTEYPPNVLALYCLRNTEEGLTNFSCLAHAMLDAPDHILAELRKPQFTQLMGVSSGGGGRYTLPILSGPENDPIYRVDFTDVEALTPSGLRALRWLRAAAYADVQYVALEPGDLLLVNNHRSVHGRVGFQPDYSQQHQRWLQRQYMTADPMRGAPYDDRWPHVWHG